jgi:hypothetical protein
VSRTPRLCRVAPLALTPLLLASTAALGASAGTGRTHHGAPKFAGLQSATTCIPGPSGPGRSSSYRLAWRPATEAGTPSRKIVYEVYQARSPGGEDFLRPAYATAPGVTSFATPPLPSEERFYFVVRARDRVGNEDANKREREGQNLCV